MKTIGITKIQLKDSNEHIYVPWCDASIETCIVAAVRDFHNKNNERTVFLMCNKTQLFDSVIEEVFRLSNPAVVVCLYNTTPYSCHFEIYRDRKAYDNYKQRERRRGIVYDGDPEFDDALEKAKDMLFQCYLIGPGMKPESMTSCFLNVGKFQENLQKIKETYVKDEKEAD